MKIEKVVKDLVETGEARISYKDSQTSKKLKEFMQNHDGVIVMHETGFEDGRLIVTNSVVRVFGELKLSDKEIKEYGL